jgi:hypothetical protein
MAVSQLSNSVRLYQFPPQPISDAPRIDVGVVAMRRAPDHLGWRLVALAVRRFRSLSPGARCVVRAMVVALCLAFVVIRLIAVIQ